MKSGHTCILIFKIQKFIGMEKWNTNLPVEQSFHQD